MEVVIGEEGTVAITSVTPNPVVTEARVAISLNEAAQATVTLVDMNGRTVATLHEGSLTAGTHELDLDASALANGVYTVVLNAAGQNAAMTVTVNK